MPSTRQRWLTRCLVTVAVGVALWQLPHRWCAHQASAWQQDDSARRSALARSTAAWLDHDLSQSSYATGSERFDGEWLFGTHLMAALGFGQLARDEPASAADSLQNMDRCLTRLLEPRLRAFDTRAWQQDGLASLDEDAGHAAFLGYLNLALGVRRFLGASRYDETHDAVSEALLRRLERSPSLLLETYPGENYPVDNASVIASVALHGQIIGVDRSGLLARWADRARSTWQDSESGLLYQRVGVDGTEALDGARGSGTALAAYFLSFADHQLSLELHHAVKRTLGDTVLGFGVVAEYPPDTPGSPWGDIDSGPLIFGYSISATGFSLATARIHDDEAWFARLYATAHLFGAPATADDRLRFVAGGPLGDAILLAMLTADRWPAGEQTRTAAEPVADRRQP